MGSKQLRTLFLKSTVALLVGIPLFVVSMLDLSIVTAGWNQLFWIVTGMVVFAVMWFSGSHFFTGAWSSFKGHNANMNTLVALATGPAWVYSLIVSCIPNAFPPLARHVYYDAPMTVIGLLMLGAALEFIAGEKGSMAIKELEKRLPAFADLQREGQKQTISANEVKEGETIFVAPGEYIPVDGSVSEGESTVIERGFSQTSRLVKKKGDPVLAGQENGATALTIRAAGPQSAAGLKQVIEQVMQAQNSKPSIGKIADKISALFAPLVIIISLLTLLGWMNFGPWPQIAYMLVTFMAVLLIACPCALGLAAPISVSTGVAKAAQNGMIFHKGNAFEELSRVKELVLNLPIAHLDTVLPRFSKLHIRCTQTAEMTDSQRQEYLEQLENKKTPYALVSNEAEQRALLDQASLTILLGPSAYKTPSDISVLTASANALYNTVVISKATLRNIKQNLSGAFAYNILAIPLAAGILYPLIKTLLSPILAGALMASSSLVVILNANRLNFLKLSHDKEAD